MGNILVGERSKITKWTPDITFIATIIGEESRGSGVIGMNIGSPLLMTFDKLGNLYVYDSSDERVLRFNVTSTSCTNNLY